MSARSDNQQVAHTIRNAVAIFAATIGLVLIIFMLAQFAIGAYSGGDRQDDPAMSAAAIAERLKPVGEVTVNEGTPAPVAATAVAAAAATAGAPIVAGADLGKTTYEAVCAVCHTAGIAGAPKTGDRAGWSARVAQGKETLYASAIQGKGVMPAKGGNPGLADDAVRAAVDYLIGQTH